MDGLQFRADPGCRHPPPVFPIAERRRRAVRNCLSRGGVVVLGSKFDCGVCLGAGPNEVMNLAGEPFQFYCSGLHGMPETVEADIPTDPVDIRFLDA